MRDTRRVNDRLIVAAAFRSLERGSEGEIMGLRYWRVNVVGYELVFCVRGLEVFFRENKKKNKHLAWTKLA